LYSLSTPKIINTLLHCYRVAPLNYRLSFPKSITLLSYICGGSPTSPLPVEGEGISARWWVADIGVLLAFAVLAKLRS
jgi:hypothetical protein